MRDDSAGPDRSITPAGGGFDSTPGLGLALTHFAPGETDGIGAGSRELNQARTT
jgi:hypothetical protein